MLPHMVARRIIIRPSSVNTRTSNRSDCMLREFLLQHFTAEQCDPATVVAIIETDVGTA